MKTMLLIALLTIPTIASASEPIRIPPRVAFSADATIVPAKAGVHGEQVCGSQKIVVDREAVRAFGGQPFAVVHVAQFRFCAERLNG